MRIGVVTTSYPSHDADSAGSFVAGHVAALRALGHTVDVIAAGPTDEAEDHVTRIASALFTRGGAPDALERGGAREYLAAASFSARLAARAWTSARAQRWDMIVAHWLAPSALAALPTRVPLLAIGHGGDVHTLRRTRLLGPALWLLRARGARLAFVGADLLALARASAPPRLANWLDRAAIVQPMGIDVARFAAIPRAQAQPPTIVLAARLVPIKGVDVAIRALDHVRTPARLAIAGDGPLREALARLAHKRPEIELLGAIDTHARDRLLARAACVVVPSRVLANGRTEGTPMIALEALASGVPVIASRVGGLADLGPEVVLVAPDDPSALGAAVDRVLARPPPAEVLRARARALAWPDVASTLHAHALAHAVPYRGE
jgi:glycosyltransferase involved in cell wall biosynthesis